MWLSVCHHLDASQVWVLSTTCRAVRSQITQTYLIPVVLIPTRVPPTDSVFLSRVILPSLRCICDIQHQDKYPDSILWIHTNTMIHRFDRMESLHLFEISVDQSVDALAASSIRHVFFTKCHLNTSSLMSLHQLDSIIIHFDCLYMQTLAIPCVPNIQANLAFARLVLIPPHAVKPIRRHRVTELLVFEPVDNVCWYINLGYQPLDSQTHYAVVNTTSTLKVRFSHSQQWMICDLSELNCSCLMIETHTLDMVSSIVLRHLPRLSKMWCRNANVQNNTRIYTGQLRELHSFNSIVHLGVLDWDPMDILEVDIHGIHHTQIHPWNCSESRVFIQKLLIRTTTHVLSVNEPRWSHIATHTRLIFDVMQYTIKAIDLEFSSLPVLMHVTDQILNPNPEKYWSDHFKHPLSLFWL